MAIPIKPSIHLSCISYHLIQGSKQTRYSQGQKHRHGSKVLKSNITQTSKHSIQASNKHIHCVHHPKCMFMWMHDLRHLTYCITAPIQQWMHMWMYVYGKTKKTLNLTFAEQTTIRQRERERDSKT